MVEILIDSISDTVKVIPVIFIIFLVVDLLMVKVNENDKFLDKFLKHGYLGGGLFGIIPQCGIPVAFARLYTSGYISLGILITVFISGSDEALIIIFGAHPEKIDFLFGLIAVKVIIGIIAGFSINLFIKEKRNKIKSCKIGCQCPKCKKDKNIFLNNLIHTAKISLYLIITVFLINIIISKIGQDNLNIVLGKNTFLQPIYASIIGMLPSCASSVIIAESFVKGNIGFAALVAGLCANTGYGVLILFKELPIKKTMRIILIVQAISIVAGELIYIF